MSRLVKRLGTPLPSSKPPRMSDRTWAVLQGRAAGGTLRAIGATLGINPERVRQIQAQGERSLRHPAAMLTQAEQRRTYSIPGDELRQLFPGGDAGTTMARNALIRRGYLTREAVARASDDDLLPLRGLGPKGLRRIRAVIPFEGVA